MKTFFFWRSPETNFLKTFFFWKTLALVSLVLDFEHSCLWPREGLSLALASDFVCVLGLEPCVLDSTSGICAFTFFEKKNKNNGCPFKQPKLCFKYQFSQVNKFDV